MGHTQHVYYIVYYYDTMYTSRMHYDKIMIDIRPKCRRTIFSKCLTATDICTNYSHSALMFDL